MIKVKNELGQDPPGLQSPRVHNCLDFVVFGQRTIFMRSFSKRHPKIILFGIFIGVQL